ncbi:serine hydrolase domain-containing protein [Kribbella sp. NPDC004536]|uniref:serine hydrolase domain-containing protein n=1 Tax=Kribbella sp. NPDC004536 TaxID=3364106 RepID=UPI0036C33FD8
MFGVSTDFGGPATDDVTHLRSLDQVARAVAGYAAYALEATGTPGGVLALGDSTGRVIELAIGWSNLAERTRMTPSLPFPAGRLGALVIGMAANRLAAQGVVDLNQPVMRYGVQIENPLGRRPVTLRDLLTHRSGLCADTFEATFTAGPVSVEQLAGPSARAPEYGGSRPRWCSPPGQRAEYSSVGLEIVVRTLAAAVDAPFAEYAHDELLAPLGLDRTSWPLAGPTPSLWQPKMTGYMVFGDTAVPTPTIRARTSHSAGIETTAGDFVRLLTALLPGSNTPDSAELTAGLGIEVRDAGSPMHSYGCSGSYPYGWWSTGRAFPALDLAVTAVGNAWNMRKYDNLSGCWASLVADKAAELRADDQSNDLVGGTDSEIAGAVAAERIFGLLGVTEHLPHHELERIAEEACPLPHRTSADWSRAEFMAGLEWLEDAHTPAQIEHKLAARPELAEYLDLVRRRWGAGPLMLDPEYRA